jgi:hypothetical protein
VRTLAIAGLLAALPTVPASAGPDDEDSKFAPTRVTARLTGITAELTARFVLASEEGWTSSHELIIPDGAVVTGATATVAGATRRLRLDAAEAVETAMAALAEAEAEGGADRGWAIELAGSGMTGIRIDMLAPRAARVALVLELEAQTCFYRDARYVQLPVAWRRALDPATRLAPAAPPDDLELACGVSLGADDAWLALPTRELGTRHTPIQRIAAIAGRLPLDPEHHFARVELALPRELGEVPRDLHTAIVFDHSRSLTVEQLEAQRAIIASYLQHAGTTRVQVIAYARRARALLPGWTAAAHAAARVDRELRGLAPRNGSNLDAGLAEAAAWLSTVRGTRRVVVLTDERLPARLDGAALALRRLLPADTLVHVVTPDGGTELARSEDGELAPLAIASGGIAVHGSVDADADGAKLLVRPLSFDGLTLEADGWERVDLAESSCPFESQDPLPEGRSCVAWLRGGALAGPITIEGRVWNQRVVRLLRPDPVAALTLARMLSLHALFDPELQTQLERAAHAVNTVWSLFARWGGSAGYADFGVGGLGLRGVGTSCCGSSFGHGGFGTFGTIGRRPPLALRDQLVPALAACGGSGDRVELVVETTREEIVDVEVTASGRDGATRRACITEAVWELALQIPDAPARASTRVVFGG